MIQMLKLPASALYDRSHALDATAMTGTSLSHCTSMFNVAGLASVMAWPLDGSPLAKTQSVPAPGAAILEWR